MSINHCTLSSATLDTFCGARRAIVVQNLLDEKYPAGNVQTGRSAYFYEPRDDVTPFTFEQPLITVNVTIDDELHTETLEATQSLDFVVVSGIEITAAPEVFVSDLTMGDPGFSVNITELSHE